MALRALELGALEVVPKPEIGIRALVEGRVARIAEIVRGVAGARLAGRASARSAPRPPTPMRAATRPRGQRAVLIGASTGGTEAIREILLALPRDCPPIVIVQHMPGAFTGAFAQRLDADCAMRVALATDGARLEPGVALVAPGGLQLEIHGGLRGPTVRVFDGPAVSGHCPSVDSLFSSAATAVGSRAVGVLLTGMGADGARGLLQLRGAGAHTIAQDERTSVVFGMPREAIALGAAAQVLPLGQVATAALAAAVRA